MRFAEVGTLLLLPGRGEMEGRVPEERAADIGLRRTLGSDGEVRLDDTNDEDVRSLSAGTETVCFLIKSGFFFVNMLAGLLGTDAENELGALLRLKCCPKILMKE